MFFLDKLLYMTFAHHLVCICVKPYLKFFWNVWKKGSAKSYKNQSNTVSYWLCRKESKQTSSFCFFRKKKKICHTTIFLDAGRYDMLNICFFLGSLLFCFCCLFFFNFIFLKGYKGAYILYWNLCIFNTQLYVIA